MATLLHRPCLLGSRTRNVHARPRLHLDNRRRPPHPPYLAPNPPKPYPQHPNPRPPNPTRLLVHHLNHLHTLPRIHNGITNIQPLHNPSLSDIHILPPNPPNRTLRHPPPPDPTPPNPLPRRLPHVRLLPRPLLLRHLITPPLPAPLSLLSPTLHNTHLVPHLRPQILVLWLAPSLCAPVPSLRHLSRRIPRAQNLTEIILRASGCRETPRRFCEQCVRTRVQCEGCIGGAMGRCGG